MISDHSVVRKYLKAINRDPLMADFLAIKNWKENLK